MWMRPVPLLFVNSAASTPIFRSTHSIASTLPVEIAVSGMFPSLLLRGMFRRPTAVVVHAGTLKENWRRQRPSWMTTGMLLPTGTLVSVKVPSYFVVTVTSGLPETSAPHWLHCTPALKGVRAAFGTYTRTSGTRSGVPPAVYDRRPARTVPAMVGDAPPRHA